MAGGNRLNANWAVLLVGRTMAKGPESPTLSLPYITPKNRSLGQSFWVKVMDFSGWEVHVPYSESSQVFLLGTQRHGLLNTTLNSAYSPSSLESSPIELTEAWVHVAPSVVPSPPFPIRSCQGHSYRIFHAVAASQNIQPVNHMIPVTMNTCSHPSWAYR